MFAFSTQNVMNTTSVEVPLHHGRNRSRILILLVWLITLLTFLQLSGCGQRGPLVRPAKQHATAVPQDIASPTR